MLTHTAKTMAMAMAMATSCPLADAAASSVCAGIVYAAAAA